MTGRDAPVPTEPPAARPCAICGKPIVERWRPFCSKRCADVDLHRWLGGRYRIPSDEPADENGGGEPRQ